MDTSDTILPNWLMRCAENFPTHLAVQCGQTRWTFADLERRVARLARQLASAGVGEGSRVALLAANGLPYVVCVHALTRLGAVLVPLNTRLTLDELCWQVRDVQAMLLLSDSQYAAVAANIGEAIPELTRANLVMSHDDEIVLRGFDAADVLPDIPHTNEAGASSDNASLQRRSRVYLRSAEMQGVRFAQVCGIEVPLHTLIDLNAVQAIMYTSGTTGQPKGVLITYGMQWWNAIGSALNLGHRPDDCWLACLPLFHIGGLSILMRSVIYGISIIVQEKFDAVAVNKAICEDNVTIISVVAVMLQRMLTALDASAEQGTRYPATLRCVLLGGGPAPRPLLEDCVRRDIPVVQTYGLTESCSQAVTLSPADALRKLGSAGRPLLPVQLRIMQDEQLASAGVPGVICLKGPTITQGYINRPDAIGDGWFSTGDIGYLDAEGYLYVLDRRSDLIVSGGENVYPAEIEAMLLAHPDVEEAGVCGQSDAQWGQVPIAFVRLLTGSTTDADALLVYAAQRLARYKLPRAIYFVEQLPRNSSGKLVRRDLPRLLL